jgi:hypothetical protein
MDIDGARKNVGRSTHDTVTKQASIPSTILSDFAGIFLPPPVLDLAGVRV